MVVIGSTLDSMILMVTTNGMVCQEIGTNVIETLLEQHPGIKTKIRLFE